MTRSRQNASLSVMKGLLNLFVTAWSFCTYFDNVCNAYLKMLYFYTNLFTINTNTVYLFTERNNLPISSFVGIFWTGWAIFFPKSGSHGGSSEGCRSVGQWSLLHSHRRASQWFWRKERFNDHRQHDTRSSEYVTMSAVNLKCYWTRVNVMWSFSTWTVLYNLTQTSWTIFLYVWFIFSYIHLQRSFHLSQELFSYRLGKGRAMKVLCAKWWLLTYSLNRLTFLYI